MEEINIGICHIYDECGGTSICVGEGELIYIILPESIAFLETVIHIIEREEIPEERNHDQENHNKSSDQDFPAFGLHMLVIHDVVMSG